MNDLSKETESTKIDDSGYFLCEGIWFNKFEKTLVDQKDPILIPLNITDLNDQILILEREVSEWLFHPMITLMNEDDNNTTSFKPFKNAIFILFGIFAYIEKIQRYRDGKSSPNNKLGILQRFFCKNMNPKNNNNPSRILEDGFLRIFPDEKGKKLKNILAVTRNKMMHTGMIGDKVLLNYKFLGAIKYDGTNTQINSIEINPKNAFDIIKIDFDNYLKELRTNSNKSQIENFQNVFNEVYEDEIGKLKKQNNLQDERII